MWFYFPVQAIAYGADGQRRGVFVVPGHPLFEGRKGLQVLGNRVKFLIGHATAVIRYYRIAGVYIAPVIQKAQFAFICLRQCIYLLHELQNILLTVFERRYGGTDGNNFTQADSRLIR